ncbi:MAG: prepilin-type N-terminal cleavage/methylation domain-containing protein [Desulfurococcaceae archaeon]
MDRKMRGISLVELLVVMVLITILAGVAVSIYSRQVQQARLREATNIVVGALEEAKSLSSTRAVMFGIRANANANRLEICQVSSNTNCQPNNQCRIINLPAGITISETVIAFDRMGYPRNASCGLGMQSIVLTAQGIDMSRTICINRYGRIRIVEGERCPQED